MISIFAKNPFRHKDGHMMRVSSMIRGQQIACFLGREAKLNPDSGFEKDICIYVKPHVPPGYDFKFYGKPYLDIVDGYALVPLLKKHPEVPVIVCAEYHLEVLYAVIPNKTIFIPQQHCNFERRVSQISDTIRNVGVIGSPKAFDFIPKEIEYGLESRGLNLIKFCQFYSRQDVVEFYGRIDLQLVWRPYRNKLPLSNPLKLVNAASFGIPTIALDEKGFGEMENCYIPVQTLDEFFEKLDLLRANMDIYKSFSERCIARSEKYHIDNVSKLYLNL